MSEYVRIFVEGENKPVITLASLQKMEERLPAHFMRVHRSYIVNLRKITEISRLRIIFDKNTYIPVGDNYKKRRDFRIYQQVEASLNIGHALPMRYTGK